MTGKVGRPSDYTLELAEEICEAIATGSNGMPVLCKENPHWPTEKNIYVWFKKHPEFRQMYLEAKLRQTEIRVDEIDSILTDESKDFYHDKEGNPSVNTAYLTRMKLLIQNRQWHAARLLPKQYGDKTETTVKQEISKESIENFREARKEFKKDF